MNIIKCWKNSKRLAGYYGMAAMVFGMPLRFHGFYQRNIENRFKTHRILGQTCRNAFFKMG